MATEDDIVGWHHRLNEHVSEGHSAVSKSLQTHGLYSPWNSPDQNTEVSSLSCLQGIFPTQGLNPGLPHCRWILYQLRHQGSPRILKWVTYPSPVDLPDPGIHMGSPALQVDSLVELPGDVSLSIFWEIVKDGEAWHAAVHEVAKIWTQLSN